MIKSIKEKVQKCHDAPHRSGLRPIQIWVPDTRKRGFKAECRRQSKLVAKFDVADKGLSNFMDNVLADMDN